MYFRCNNLLSIAVRLVGFVDLEYSLMPSTAYISLLQFTNQYSCNRSGLI